MIDLTKKFFNMKGRLNRKPFFLRTVILFAITVAMNMLMEVTENSVMAVALFAAFLSIIVGVAIMISYVSLMIRRLNDLNKEKTLKIFLVVLGLLPVTSLLIMAYLLSAKGTPGSNKYGDDPIKDLI